MDHNLRFLVRFCALLLINLLSFCVCFNKQQESQTLTPGKSWGNDSPTPVTACPALPRLPTPLVHRWPTAWTPNLSLPVIPFIYYWKPFRLRWMFECITEYQSEHQHWILLGGTTFSFVQLTSVFFSSLLGPDSWLSFHLKSVRFLETTDKLPKGQRWASHPCLNSYRLEHQVKPQWMSAGLN